MISTLKFIIIGLLFFSSPPFFAKTVTSTTCDFFTNEPLSFSPLTVGQNYENSFYLITDESGQMANSSEGLNFSSINEPGTYYLQGLFYEGTIIVSSTGGGINTNSFVPTG